MNHSKPSVAVIIVTWNSEKDIARCLESVQKTDYINTSSVIVVDNNSSDKTVSIVKQNYPWVELLEQKENTFFTGGNNIGFTYAIQKYNVDYVITLNPDTEVQPSWITEMIHVAETNPRIGIVGPKIVFWNNKNQGKINSAGMIFDGFIQAYDRGFEEVDTGQFDQQEDVLAVTGTCMLLKTEMLEEIGMFWERLRMYLEDVELCIRAKKHHWYIVYTPRTVVHHTWMQSTNQSNIVRKKGWMIRNWLLIALRHYPIKRKLAMIKKFLEYHVGRKDNVFANQNDTVTSNE